MSKKNWRKPKQQPPRSPNPPAASAASKPEPLAGTNASNSPEKPQYEFTDSQNRVINDLAMAITWVRLPMLMAGLLLAIIATGLAFRLPKDGAHIVGVIGNGLGALVCFLLSGWLSRAANEFTLITTTKGRDISHLMTALRNLDGYFDLLAFFVKMYLFLLGVLVVIMMVGLIAGVFKEPGVIPANGPA